MHGIWRKLAQDRLYDFIQPIPGAIDGLHTLRAMGFRVVIATNRPTSALPVLKRWFRYYHFTPDDYFLGEDKWQAGGDLFIDDKPETVLTYARQQGPAILEPGPLAGAWESRVSAPRSTPRP